MRLIGVDGVFAGCGEAARRGVVAFGMLPVRPDRCGGDLGAGICLAGSAFLAFHGGGPPLAAGGLDFHMPTKPTKTNSSPPSGSGNHRLNARLIRSISAGPDFKEIEC